jgi:outer membrane protein
MRLIMGLLRAATVVSCVAAAPAMANAETITGAMAKAYDNNPDLNAARAGLRATDEGVAIARAGMRPIVSGEVSLSRTESSSGFGDGTDAVAGITFNQPVFDGFRTRNAVLGAQSDVFSGQEQLRNTEQEILLTAVQAFMNVVRDRQIVSIRRQNLAFLREQLNAADARFQVGEGTRTDVSQARASLAAADAGLVAATAQLRSSEAVYVQIVGDVAPANMSPSSASTAIVPNSLDEAIRSGLADHPVIRASEFAANSADFGVKEAEGVLLPGVSVNGSVGRDLNQNETSASITARLTVPIYQGGAEYARVRQSKELLSQARINVDVARNNVRQAVVSAWTQYDASRAAIAANRSQLDASNLALSGVVEERNVGQRTTLDVLNAQQNVLNAQEALAQSQRDAVVASFSVLSTTGRLNVRRLGLAVAEYRPEVNYEAVKDKWYGLRTVDGR